MRPLPRPSTPAIYAVDEIVWDSRFAEVFDRLSDGTRVIDYSRFHEIIPIDE